MTEVKIPEPFRKQGQQIAFDGCDRAQADYFTEAQLKQYGDDRAREVLDMAANVAKKYNHPIAGVIANEIRALKASIK